MGRYRLFFALIAASILLGSCNGSSERKVLGSTYSKWENYAGTKDGSRYSSLDQITTKNVGQLALAWSYSTGDKDSNGRSQNQCNPIIVDGILYGTSAKLKLFALDAATGEEHWVFDPATVDTALANDPMGLFKINRGLAYWEDRDGKGKRIFYSVGAKVYAIDAQRGVPIERFGGKGFIDLSENLDREPGTFNSFVAGTSPGIVYKDLLILGFRVAESADAAPGHIRAYDVLTGDRRWIFHTIPHPGEFGYDTWPDSGAYQKLGGANNWAGMSLDEKRGIVYVPTGSISGDFYGGIREGQNLFANSLLALDAATGKYLWHFQTVHHDLWDRDLSANPNLVTLNIGGKQIDAVAQITKQGYTFVFDRLTGDPIFPIVEKPVPQEALPGEKPWPTQPIPTLPEPFARQGFEEGDVTNLTPETHKMMLERYRQVKNKEMYTPPSKEGNWIFPGFDGGGEWGGASIDPETQILYVNSSELPWTMTMEDIPLGEGPAEKRKSGALVYKEHCASCHGADLKGNGPSFPALEHIERKYNAREIMSIVNNGINMMPAFRHIAEYDKTALVNYLARSEALEMPKEPEAMADEVATSGILAQVPYRMTGYNRFLDNDGYPGITPPWGTLNAINLNTGKLLWKVPLGEYPELTARGHPATGTENYGGPVVTKGGLVFIAATKDAKIRAFDKTSGAVLWEADLPVPGFATPAVYEVGGKQYVVIACGGGKIGAKSGDEYLCFSLP